MIAITVLLLAFVVGLVMRLIKAWLMWRRVPLQQKNQTRAGVGAFVVMAAIGAWGLGAPISPYVLAGLALLGLLYLVVGIHGAHGATFDLMSLIWWGVGLVGCVALLLFKGFIGWPSWLT